MGWRCHVGRSDTRNRPKLGDIWVEGPGQLGLVIKAEVVQGEVGAMAWREGGHLEQFFPPDHPSYARVCQVRLARVEELFSTLDTAISCPGHPSC